MLALRNEVESAGNHLEIHGGLNEGTGMKTFLLSPMFLAKALKLRFRVGELDPPPICLVHHDPTHGECAALSSQLCLTHVSPHHNPFGCFKDSPIRLPRLFAAVDHSAASTPNTKGAASVYPSVARTSLRSSTTMHPYQVLSCPPGLRFSLPAIVPNITRLGNRS